MKRKPVPREGLFGEHALREARDYRLTIDAVRAAIQATWRAALAPDERCPWVDLVGIDDSRGVVMKDGKTWAYPYTIDDAYKVALQDAVPVVQEWKTVKVTEAVERDAVLEATRGDGDKPSGKFAIVAIRSGLSGNGNFYSDTSLREAVSLFEGARVFVKSDAEHLAGAGKDVRNLIGQLVGAKFVEGKEPDTGHIAATLQLIEPEGAIGTKLRKAYDRGMHGLFGFSIDAVAKTATVVREGKRIRVATKFKKVSSVDLIVEPGAGGALVRMVEAAESEEEQRDMSIRQRLLEAIKKANPTKAASIDLATITDEDLEAAYREAIAATPPQPDPNKEVREAAPLTAAEVTALVAQSNARSYARVTIDASKLPPKTRERLQKHFDATERFTESQVDQAVKEAREEIGSFTESGRVSMGDYSDVSVEDRSKKIADMLDAFFDPKHKDHASVQSFKECYIEITGDRRVSGLLRDCDRGRLRESLASTTWDDALGNSITRRMIAIYRDSTDLNWWRKICRTTPVSDFRTQERFRIGGYGNLPIVAEGGSYAALTSPTDEKATYAVRKRGGTEDITREMIKNDDVGAIKQIPVELGRAAGHTLSEFVFDFIRTNPTAYDGVALFHATHNNLFTAALSAVEFAAHRLAMKKQTRPGSSKRYGYGPAFLLVSADLEETAFNMFNRNTNLDKTFVQSLNPEIIPVSYWTDANDWATVVNPMDMATIEVGFLDGREEPELFVQDMPNVGSMFSNDKLTYKIRHEYDGAPVEFRGMTKAVVP